ncbi:alpha/beta fold hydrolase [Propionibacteriaceae bacterium G57]|uniref:alpha/beta fold hydrolase n=1 Tax=Aestuariimicrobium sp. G57 TaxID=3418485 RepID=UPI003DA755CD
MLSSVFDLQANGIVIGVHEWMPDTGAPVGVVQVVHGMAEHGGRYAALAETLTAAGWVVVAADLRGHGRTAQVPAAAGSAVGADPLGNLGHFADKLGWRSVVDDLRAVNLHIASRHPDVPVVMLGHSMGSLLARDFAASYPQALDGLVLTGTRRPAGLIGTAGKALATAIVRSRGPRHRSQLLHQLNFGTANAAFKPTRTEYDWLSRDAAEVDAYIADPLCGFTCTAQFYVDIIGGLARVNSRKQMKKTPKSLPVLVLSGSADPIGGDRAATAVKALLRSLGNKRVQVVNYRGARHELFHETNRVEVVGDLVRWLDDLGAPDRDKGRGRGK